MYCVIMGSRVTPPEVARDNAPVFAGGLTSGDIIPGDATPILLLCPHCTYHIGIQNLKCIINSPHPGLNPSSVHCVSIPVIIYIF